MTAWLGRGGEALARGSVARQRLIIKFPAPPHHHLLLPTHGKNFRLLSVRSLLAALGFSFGPARPADGPRDMAPRYTLWWKDDHCYKRMRVVLADLSYHRLRQVGKVFSRPQALPRRPANPYYSKSRRHCCVNHRVSVVGAWAWKTGAQGNLGGTHSRGRFLLRRAGGGSVGRPGGWSKVFADLKDALRRGKRKVACSKVSTCTVDYGLDDANVEIVWKSAITRRTAYKRLG